MIVNGIKLGTACAQIKQAECDDLALLELAAGSSCAAVFTRNAFCAAPVTVAREHLAATNPRYLLINSGNANAGTGARGLEDALSCCEAVAKLTNCAVNEVLPFSTGVIGQTLPVEKIKAALPAAIAALDSSGMIKPDMATMLSYVATDVKAPASVLQAALNQAIEKSFNRITIDSDTSTNDACVLIATGKGLAIDSTDHPAFMDFRKAVTDICLELAQAIVRDGEGATKFITVSVEQGASGQECLDVAYTIAHSPLVKTAFFASDPNWGRILAAVGRSGIEEFDINAVKIYLDDVCIVENGGVAETYTEQQGQEVMNKTDITISVLLGRGEYQNLVYTSDLSYDYVKINAEYRT